MPNGTVLVDTQLWELAKTGQIDLKGHLDRVQPASIDLVVKTDNIYEVAGIPNLNSDFSCATFLDGYALNHETESDGVVNLGCNRVYLAEIEAGFNLSDEIFGYANPKSSMGRIDVHCTIIAEGAREFNYVPEGYKGKLYILIVPQSFPIKLHVGDSLCQLRLIKSKRVYIEGRKALMELDKTEHIFIGGHPGFKAEGVVLHLDLKGSPSNLVANRTGRPLDLKARGTLEPTAFFREKLLDNNGNLFLEPGEFVLAATVEKLSIPDYICGEMMAFDERWGEIRTHYAGFFDPGFGRGRDTRIQGNSVVCEIRNIGTVPVILSHNQAICMMRFEYVSQTPDQVYGETRAVEATNYSVQKSLRLGKYFKEWKSA